MPRGFICFIAPRAGTAGNAVNPETERHSRKGSDHREYTPGQDKVRCRYQREYTHHIGRNGIHAVASLGLFQCQHGFPHIVLLHHPAVFARLAAALFNLRLFPLIGFPLGILVLFLVRNSFRRRGFISRCSFFCISTLCD